MKKLLSLSLALFLISTLTWATGPTVVTSDAEIRSAIQADNASIQLGADIYLSNSTLSIPANHTVTLDLNSHKLDRKLTKRGEGGGGLFNATNGTATLNNVTISGNEAKHYGGGGICNFGTQTLNGVTIQNNKAGSMGGPFGRKVPSMRKAFSLSPATRMPTT